MRSRFMKYFFQITLLLLIAALFTLITQIGGILLLLHWLVVSRFPAWRLWAWRPRLAGTVAFWVIYLVVTLWLVPPLAKYLYNRVPLPMSASASVPVGAHNILYCLANRHYVKPELKRIAIVAAQQLKKEYPQAVMRYFDAGFPFLRMPLLPHITHEDGRKLDIGFFYLDKNKGTIVSSPSFLGYGVCEGPKPGEYDRPAECTAQGSWQYSIVYRYTPQRRSNYQFEEPINKRFLEILADQPQIRRMLIEPHLKTRLGLSGYDKIRKHGCFTVRHDDHVHVQI